MKLQSGKLENWLECVSDRLLSTFLLVRNFYLLFSFDLMSFVICKDHF